VANFYRTGYAACLRSNLNSISKSEMPYNIREVGKVPNTKPLSGNIQIRIKTCRTLKFMQTTLWVKTLRSEDEIALSEEKRTPMPRRRRDYNLPWVFNNLYTILFAPIGGPGKFLQSPLGFWQNLLLSKLF
jgi:hypothetical protein